MNFQHTFIYCLLFLLVSCSSENDPAEIIQNTINSIDTIKTIYYKQTQFVGNSDSNESVIQKERAFYCERLSSDTIIGAKAHIYFYDSTIIFLEDIYDGNKLIRKHHRDSSARVYDLLKYPDLKRKPFWGKITPYVIQYMLNYAVENKAYYTFALGEDSIVNGKNCYALKTILSKKALMPGFHKFVDDANRVETMILFIDKSNYYPQRLRMEVYFIDNPDKIYFTDNTFYNISFNPKLNDSLFNTSEQIINGFRIHEIKP